MSTGGSFWHRLRMRLGGSDAMLAQLSDLIQKQIDANADVQEVTEEAILNPIIIAPSKMVLRDNLFRVVTNTVSEGLNNLLPIDPDLDLMRLWVKNDHGGRYLTDYSFMGNTVQLNGADQSKLIFTTVDDQVDNSSIVNQFRDDQYIRVEDKDKSPNLNVRIKEIAATAEGISVFTRLYIQRNDNEATFGKPGVLFSKIDTEQVDYAYGAYLRSDGSIFFFVREAAREYTLTTPAAALVYTQANLPDYTDTDYKPTDFHTVSTLDAVPDPITFADITFTYTFANKRMQIYKSIVGSAPTVIADSNSNPEASGLVGWWRLNEGGDIGNTPDGPVSFARTVYNSVSTGNNGLITNATWDTTTFPGAAFLKFDGNGDTVDITNYTAINNLTSATVSLWYYHGGNVSVARRLIYKNTVAAANSWLIDIGTNGRVTFTARNSVNTAFTTSPTTVLTINTWYHIVARWVLGTSAKVTINGAHTTGTTPTGTMDTGATTLRCGDTGTSCALGHIHDVKIWNRQLSDAEVATTLYPAGHQASYLPSWQANPPLVPGAPGPVTNPFVSVYLAPAAGGVPAAGEQDLVRLHAITASSLTTIYTVGQGAQQTPSAIPDDPQYYDNDPAYDAGTAVQETLSTYAESSRTAVSAQYLSINCVTFAGQKFLTGSDVVGKPVTKVIAKMADVNTNNTPATGNIVAKIVTAGGVTQTTSTNTVDSGIVTNNQGGSSTANWSTHTFTFSTSYVMATGDKVQFEYDQGGVPPEGVTQYAQLATTPVSQTGSSLNYLFFCGQRFLTGSDVVGKAITKVVVRLCDLNPTNAAATGNVTGRIVKADGTSVITSNTVAATGLADNAGGAGITASDWTSSTFTFSGNSYIMATGDRFQLEYDQGGSAGAPGTETLSTYQQVNLGSSAGDSDVFNTQYCAEVVDDSSCPFYNKVVSKIVVACARNSSATTLNTLHAQIVTSGGTVKSTSNMIDTDAAMPNFYPGFYALTFTFSGNTYAMQVNDYIRINYNWGGASGNGSVAISANPNAEPGCHIFEVVNTTRTDTTDYDIEMDVYTQTPGPYKQVGVAAVTTDPETNSNTYDAQWATPATLTQNASVDWLMDVYAGNTALAKTIGIAYSTTAAQANSNAYDAPWSTGTVADKSTFDLGIDVYIDTKTGTPNHQYTQMQNSGSKFVALYISSGSAGLVAKQPTKFTFRVNKVGAPTGSIFCRIKKGSDGTTITFPLTQPVSAASIDVSTLTTAAAPATLYTFELDSNGQTGGYALQSGDRVMLELSGGTSSGSAYAQIARTTTTSRIANVNLQTSPDGTTWTSPNSSLDDTIGVVYVGGYTPPPIFPYHTLGYGNTRITQKVTSTTASAGNIYNQRVTQVKPWLKRIGSPTGLINVVIRSAADAQVASINTLDASSVDNATFTQYTFTNLNNTYTMALNDRVCVEFSGGDVNNHIQCNTNLLDTYPYGMLETYAGTSYTSQLLHDIAGNMSSGGGSTDPLARTRVGEKVATTSSALKLKKISRITVYMKRTVSPTGNVTFRIRNSADAVVATLGTQAAGSIDPNTPTAYTITSSPISSYALQVGDYVSVEYNLGDDANFVEIMTSKTTDIFDGVIHTYLSKYDDVNWVPNTAIDLVGQMWEGGDTYTPSQEDVLIPDPKYTKDLTVLAGGSPWTWINHDRLTSTYAASQLFVNAIMPEFRLYRKVLTLTEITNINTNRLDRGTIPLGQVSKFAYSFISET